jgi:hypothetical protein
MYGTGIDPIDLIAEWLPCMISVYMNQPRGLKMKTRTKYRSRLPLQQSEYQSKLSVKSTAEVSGE